MVSILPEYVKVIRAIESASYQILWWQIFLGRTKRSTNLVVFRSVSLALDIPFPVLRDGNRLPVTVLEGPLRQGKSRFS